MKIIHRRNFQNFYSNWIYLSFNFTLKSMGNAHLIKISFLKITFSCKSLGRKFHIHSFYQNMK
jgi:hypothetical protein